MSESLWLKSAESPIANDASKQPGPNAVLCTDDHTFQLRQVQSSNSVFILQPSESRRGENEITPPILSAIAQCTSTLELVTSNAAVSITLICLLLKESLHEYKGIETGMVLGTNIESASKRNLFKAHAVRLQSLTIYQGSTMIRILYYKMLPFQPWSLTRHGSNYVPLKPMAAHGCQRHLLLQCFGSQYSQQPLSGVLNSKRLSTINL